MKYILCLYLVLLQFALDLGGLVSDNLEECKKQSPVDLDASTATKLGSENEAAVDKSFFTSEMKFYRLGQSVFVRVVKPHLDYYNRYLVFIYFKWPSEHTVKGKHYPFEIGLVRYSRSNVGRQVSKKLTVTAVFGEVGSQNTEIGKFVGKLSHISAPNDHATYNFTETVGAHRLTPSTVEGYYRYDGSLHTFAACCYENVVYIIPNKTITMSQQQIDSFKELKFKNGSKMESNARNTQPLSGREIEFLVLERFNNYR